MIATVTSSDELRELYRELILDHARTPRHFGKLDDATHRASGVNPLCGDKLEVFLNISPDGRIDDVSFEGTGCAISVASASLLTESVAGLTSDEALKRFATVVDALAGEDACRGDDLGKLAALLGVREFPSRVKCATLSWHALRAAINENTDTATTE